jgi:hypothetical protein
LGQQLPLHALQLLRACCGACRFEHLACSSPPSSSFSSAASSASVLLRDSLCSIVDADLPDAAWDQARLPVRHGGLGIRDATLLYPASRLGCLIQIQQLAVQLGCDPGYVQSQITHASDYLTQCVGLVPVNPRTTAKELHDVIIHRLKQATLRNRTPMDTARLLSLRSPHAGSWTSGFSPHFVIPPARARAGLRWFLGLHLTPNDYTCSFCNKRADSTGLHAVTCQLSGAIGRGHTALKRTVYELAKTAGYEVALEVALPQDPHSVPADLLVKNFNGSRALALDFTIVSPVLPSRACSQPSPDGLPSSSRLDAAAALKIKKSAAACRQAGWDFLPVVADTYGAFRADGRTFLSKLIRQARSKFPHIPPGQLETQAWQALSAAAISRAATQLAHEAEIFNYPCANTTAPEPVALPLSEIVDCAANPHTTVEPLGTPTPFQPELYCGANMLAAPHVPPLRTPAATMELDSPVADSTGGIHRRSGGPVAVTPDSGGSGM